MSFKGWKIKEELFSYWTAAWSVSGCFVFLALTLTIDSGANFGTASIIGLCIWLGPFVLAVIGAALYGLYWLIRQGLPIEKVNR